MNDSTRHLVTSVAFAAAVLAAVVSPAIVVAGEPTRVPAEWALVDINAEYVNAETSYCLVGGQLPTTTPLPAPVQIAVPASSTPQWVGEVVLGNAAADKPLRYTVARRGTMDIYSMMVQTSRLAQVEALVPGLVTESKGTYTASIAWVAPAPAPRVRVSVSLPPNAQISNGPADAQTAKPSPSATYYYRDVLDVQAGDNVELHFTYKVPEQQTGEIPKTGGTPTVLWVILGVGLVAVVVLAVAVMRQRPRAAEYEDSEGEDDQ